MNSRAYAVCAFQFPDKLFDVFTKDPKFFEDRKAEIIESLGRSRESGYHKGLGFRLDPDQSLILDGHSLDVFFLTHLVNSREIEGFLKEINCYKIRLEFTNFKAWSSLPLYIDAFAGYEGKPYYSVESFLTKLADLRAFYARRRLKELLGFDLGLILANIPQVAPELDRISEEVLGYLGYQFNPMAEEGSQFFFHNPTLKSEDSDFEAAQEILAALKKIQEIDLPLEVSDLQKGSRMAGKMTLNGKTSLEVRPLFIHLVNRVHNEGYRYNPRSRTFEKL